MLIHSINREMYKTHLEQVLQLIKEAGLTLKGCKCRIGKDEVIYLGHVFSANGMRPDAKKIAVVKDWPTPKDAEGQKMEGLLCRWALALQEYDFIIQYCKGSQNSNGDALSLPRLKNGQLSLHQEQIGIC